MRFRDDIQILRGVSVLLVVLFHLEVPGFQSGFLGVDLFFLISGFLMAVLYDQSEKAEFYRRRAGRLLPAYFFTIILSLIAAYFITTPNEFNQVSTQVKYAAVFLSNFGFWLDISYFDKSAYSLLLHLWSLGVEIQFYLLVPLLVYCFRKHKLVLPIVIMCSLFYVSLFYDIHLKPLSL